MAGPLLAADERLVSHLRRHERVLLRPALFLILASAVLGFALAALPGAGAEWGAAALWLVYLVAVGRFSLYPYLRWLTTTYTITDRRIISRSGIISQQGHDLPLHRVLDVTYRRSFLDRLFGCGTLTLLTAAEGALPLVGVPDVERLHLQLTGLIHGPQGPHGSVA